MKEINVAVNGYGVIGKRVAEAVTLQDDMELIGIGDVAADWRIQSAESKGYSIFANTEEGRKLMTSKNIQIAGGYWTFWRGCHSLANHILSRPVPGYRSRLCPACPKGRAESN